MEMEMDGTETRSPDIELVQEQSMDAEPIIQETAEPKRTDDELTGSYTWRILNFRNCSTDRQYSEKFDIGTYIWRFLVFPRGNLNNNKDPGNWLAVYLDAPEATYTPLSMSPKAKFSLVLLNQEDGKHLVKETSHTFVSDASDWGFNQFIRQEDLLDPKNGWLHGDDLLLRVDITIQKDERYAYDSRKETGYVGLKNQGATCYMNSLLQTLFHLPYFRQAVYHMPTSETDEPSSNMPLALQSLFYKLQYSRTSVSTKDLTKSFGWGTYDAFMQHDVQELNRVLCEKLEGKMKGTKVERVINQLFEGTTYNFIKCIHVDASSERKETFMDLQLDVRGCRDVYASLDRYTEPEVMDGANQYKSEQFGLQDAKKGVLFHSLPPVLQLHLKRFDYDFQRDTQLKINDRYEFPEELDLDLDGGRYLSPGADRSVRLLYRLHSVLVHSGGGHGGHYYAFIRPDAKTWLKFDDERVTLEDKRRAMDEQFGGDEDSSAPGYPCPPGPPLRLARLSNAYMLVYVRVEDWERVMCPVTKRDIAEHLLKRLEAEQADKEQRQKDKAEAHQYISLKAFDLVDHERLAPGRGAFRVKKSCYFAEFKQMVARELGVGVEQQRYWVWSRRPNATYRVSRVLTAEEEALQLMDLKDLRDTGGSSSNKSAMMDIRLFLETGSSLQQPDPSRPLYSRKDDLFLFVKAYDPAAEQLTYCGRFYAPKNARPADLNDMLGRMAGFTPPCTLDVYEEVKSEPEVWVTLLDKKRSLSTQKLEDGDILVVQRRLSEEAAAGFRHPSAKQYFEYVRQRRYVRFVPLADPQAEGLTVELRQSMSYEEVTQALASALGLQPAEEQRHFLRLTQHSQYSHGPQRHPMKSRTAPASLAQMLLAGPHAQAGGAAGAGGPGVAAPTDVLYYEQLDMPLEQLEQLKTLKVHFHNDSGAAVSEHTVRLQRDASVADLTREVAAQVGAPLAGKTLRLLEVLSSKLYRVHHGSDLVEQLDDAYWRLRVEVVPPGEEGLEAGPPALTALPGTPSAGETRAQSGHGNGPAPLAPAALLPLSPGEGAGPRGSHRRGDLP
ncbi:hypothetical protein V8C86DRAFT_1411207 [Haematococcus lacustris]